MYRIYCKSKVVTGILKEIGKANMNVFDLDELTEGVEKLSHKEMKLYEKDVRTYKPKTVQELLLYLP